MPAEDRIGPYRIIAPLGRGGVGIVYKAWHEATGDVVALKTVRAADVRSLQMLRREIHALMRLDHPGIVRVLDTGEAEGIPWYAMALCEGLTLRRLQSSRAPAPASREWWTEALDDRASDDTTAAGTVSWVDDPTGAPTGTDSPRQHARREPDDRPAPRLPLLQSLGIVRRVCHALAYMHGEGVIHRDLKPENVLVQGDGMPVIVDFGLAASLPTELAREDLSEATEVAGTVTYMAPEQASADLVDARSDIYSLGCILYELVTGRPPFFGESPMEVLAKHMGATAATPSSISHGIPGELDELTMCLLAKRPSDRIGYADVVASRLLAIERALGETTAEDAGAPPRRYLYRPAFSGRGAIVEGLQDVLAEARTGKGRLVLLSGESGAGKTRLLLALLSEARNQRIPVLTGDCVPGVAEATAEPLLQALRPTLQHIRDRCLERGREETERLLGRRGASLAAFDPAIAELPGQAEHARGADLPPDESRLRLFVDLEETLRALAGDRPLLLLLDDLQWADELTLGLLHHAGTTGALDRGRIVVVGTFRTEEASTAIEQIRRAHGVLTLDVPRLEGSAVAAIAAGMLATTPEALPEGFAAFLEGASEGNPFFVAEYLRSAVEEELLVRDGLGRWTLARGRDGQRIELPRSLRSLVGRRLLSLPPDSLELLQIASVFGREVDAGILMDATGLRQRAFFEALVPPLSRHVLEDGGRGALRFVHDKLREAAYAAIPGASRPGLHRAAAQVIERRAALAHDDDDLARLGNHWEIAGEVARARAYYLRAARHALKSHAYDEAERLYRAVIALSEVWSPETLDARSELAGRVLQMRGRDREAFQEYTRALVLARAVADRAREAHCLRHLGDIESDTGRLDDGQRHYEEALAVARAAGLRSIEGSVYNSMGTRMTRQAREEEALALYEKARAIAAEEGDRRDEAGITGNMANIHWQRGRTGLARPLFERVIAIQRELGEERGVAITLGNLAGLLESEDRKKARELGHQSLQILRSLGDRHMEVLTMANVAMLEDVPRDAIAMLSEALVLTRSMGERSMEGHVLGNLGEIHRRLGDLDAATACHEQAFAIAIEVNEPRQQAFQLALLAGVARDRGDVLRARALYTESLAVSRSVGHDREVASTLDKLAALPPA